MRVVHTAPNLALVALLLALLGGCEFHCSVGGPSEPTVAGPVTSPPEGIPPHVDTVAPDTATFFVAWAHPETGEGDVITGRLVAVDVGGVVPPGTRILEVPITLETGQGQGVFSFDRPDAGWPPGTYRVEVLRAGAQFGQVEFTIAPAASP
jgi:hypothetical protein